MEIRNVSATAAKPATGKAILTGRVISYLCILFLLFDAIMKIMLEPHSIEGSVALGWPEQSVRGLGTVLLICTILYTVPRTAFTGAILLTGYLGGAIAIMFIAGQPFYFPLILGMLIWAGLALRNEKIRTLILG
jgi:hypothetical protein